MFLTKKELLNGLLIFLSISILSSCATTNTTKTPTLSIEEYGFQSSSKKIIQKSDISISITPIRIDDIYNYPNLFGFRLQNFPQYADNYYLKNNLPVGPQNLRWTYPFATPDLREQLQLYYVKIENNTDHILRMKDSRVYMTTDGEEPIPAIKKFDKLVEKANRFERIEKRQYDSQTLKIGEYPTGITEAILNSKKEHYDLINSLGKEVLPGYSLEGLLVFPVLSSTKKTASISFFDITTKTDAAGNPTEKTQFDFPLEKKTIKLWYDRDQKKWREGVPPAKSTGS